MAEEQAPEVAPEVAPETPEQAPEVAPEVAPEASTEEVEAAQEAINEAIKKYQCKVDGKEFERELDLSKDEEIVKLIQLAEMSGKRAQESAELRKSDIQRNEEVQSFLDSLTGNTAQTLAKLGIDVKAFAEKVMDEQIEDLELSDEQREIKRLQTELEAKIQGEKEAKELAEKDKYEALQNKYAAEWEKDLIESIDDSGLPNNTEVVSRMTRLMGVALENGIDLSFKDVVPLVREEMNSDIQKMLGKMPSEVIEKLLGEDRIKEMSSKIKVKKDAPPTADQILDTATKKKTEPKIKPRTKSAKDFFSKL